MSRRRKPSRKRRHRESVAARRRARAFYRMRSCGADVLPPDEAEAMRPWRGYGFFVLFVLAAAAAIAVAGRIVAAVFS